MQATFRGAKAGQMKLDRSPTEAVTGVAKRPIHILVVEDELFIRMSISDAFRDEGYTVIEAFNADEAVDVLTAGTAVDSSRSDFPTFRSCWRQATLNRTLRWRREQTIFFPSLFTSERF
jgi:hypothetical protein